MNKSSQWSRRQLLQATVASSVAAFITAPLGSRTHAAASGAEADNWNQGELAHLIPVVNHEQILIKASFTRAQAEIPVLRVGERRLTGQMTDTQGRFWLFHATGLAPDNLYELQLEFAKGQALTDPWPLKTFPAPDSRPEHMRILTYTCAGGNDSLKMEDGTPYFLEMTARHRLMQRGMAFEPDVVIANGDHVYWDQRTVRNKPDSFSKPWLELFEEYGSLNPKLPVLGSSNESILTRIVDPQIADLYGVTLRSVPVFMLTDDHDLFENDEANDEFITLPPNQQMLDAARSTQHLYYPEFLPDPTRSLSLPGSSSSDRLPGLSEVYGTVRYGRLLEALLYDTKRYSTIDGETAKLFPANTEEWLAQRTHANDTDHLLHVPSTPIGWSAGKWGEWYPDVRQKDGTLGIESPKPYWPSGWWEQHQRVLGMLHQQQERTPVIVSGDLHAFSYGKILRSGELDFGNNPIHTACVGPLASSGPGFPSQYRGVEAQVPSMMTVEELVKPLEKNGFTVIDITPKKMTFRMFSWRPPEPIETIDSLQPFFTYEIDRPA